MERMLDHLSRRMGQATSRRQAMKMLGAGLVGSAVFARSASAAPRTCVTCICGTGRPCNPKSTACTEVREFPAEQACAEACAQKNQSLCGLGNTFHCPRGCPA